MLGWKGGKGGSHSGRFRDISSLGRTVEGERPIETPDASGTTLLVQFAWSRLSALEVGRNRTLCL